MPASTAELRVAVVGAGRMGAFHVETWERIPEATLVALADPDEAIARERIGRRPIAWDADWRATLERDDVDAVTVAAPTALHAEITLAALDAGKHVLVEKPIAGSLDEAVRMGAAAEAAGRKLMVGHVERFNPAVAKVSELLASERVGRVFRAEAVRVGPLPARVADVGVAMDLATHDLDILQHVLGRDITRVYAQGRPFTQDAHEDLLTCLLTFGEDGPFGLLDVNWLTPEKRRELTVLGEGGMLRASYLTQDVWFVESATTLTGWDELALVRGDAEGSVVRFALRKVEPLRAELEAFARCVLDDTPEPVSARDGARALEAALAVLESARSGEAVGLGEAHTAH
jgi:UDP-N-acetylglucosamine 3-dehydrogenase